jgi:DNA-binding HxlR family transcriptional regulator
MIDLHNKKYTCPVDVTLGFVGGKWKILILSHLLQFGDKSYSDIKRNLPSISEKMLSQQLKELERDKLITKKIISEKPYRVEYFLSQTGQSLSPLFTFLSEWGMAYLKQNGIDYIKDQHLYK